MRAVGTIGTSHSHSSVPIPRAGNWRSHLESQLPRAFGGPWPHPPSFWPGQCWGGSGPRTRVAVAGLSYRIVLLPSPTGAWVSSATFLPCPWASPSLLPSPPSHHNAGARALPIIRPGVRSSWSVPSLWFSERPWVGHGLSFPGASGREQEAAAPGTSQAPIPQVWTGQDRNQTAQVRGGRGRASPSLSTPTLPLPTLGSWDFRILSLETVGIGDQGF